MGMRKIATLDSEDGKRRSIVTYDSVYREYWVRFLEDGKEVGEDSRYPTSDRHDAMTTAGSWLKG
ncbi:hypothetical protein Arno162_33 [Pectobacterium phage Arno162]|uniref:Uncharacterized protein n=1 Tax=Pectobacterium phage Arno162 TaxID=2500577 RepID=A0A678ZX59_9CAUD|nr:hypothetical protein Arno162_33 [Pectobacterium phage Arno162]